MKSKTINYLSIGIMCLFLTIGTISSCVCGTEDNDKVDNSAPVENPNLPVGEKANVSSRIKISNYVQGEISSYEIVEVDGQEYLSSYRGGLIKLDSRN